MCVCVYVYLFVWFGHAAKKNNDKLDRIVRNAVKIIGVGFPSLEESYRSRVLKRMHSIIDDEDHPGHSLFQFSSSKRRLRYHKVSKRFLDCFYPSATRLFKV